MRMTLDQLYLLIGRLTVENEALRLETQAMETTLRAAGFTKEGQNQAEKPVDNPAKNR